MRKSSAIPWILAALLLAYGIGERGYVRKGWQYARSLIENYAHPKEDHAEGYEQRTVPQKSSTPLASKKPGKKSSWKQMTQKDLDRVYRRNSPEQQRSIWVDTGIKCDLNGDGNPDYVIGYTLMRSGKMRFFTEPGYVRVFGNDPAQDGGIEIFSESGGGFEKIYEARHLWNFSCDSLYVKDTGNGPVLFVSAASGGNKLFSWNKAFRWDDGLVEVKSVKGSGYRELTRKDFDRMYPDDRRKGDTIIEGGIACDLDRNGSEDFIAARTYLGSPAHYKGKYAGRIYVGNTKGNIEQSSGRMRFFNERDPVSVWDIGNNSGRLEIFSDSRKIFTSYPLWNGSCDMLFADDLDEDGVPEIFVESENKKNGEYFRAVGVYRYDNGLKMIGEFIGTKSAYYETNGKKRIIVHDLIGDMPSKKSRIRVSIYEWDGKKFVKIAEKETLSEIEIF
jgi:hypothetical protein